MKKVLKKIIPLSFINRVKSYLAYIPFEKGSLDNGVILSQYHYHDRKEKNLCLFSHFDKYNCIDAYVLVYLEGLLEQGYDIVFISTAENLAPSEVKKVSTLCRDVIIKENKGYDFGAWQTALTYLADELNRYDSLLLCNDSVYAPLFDLNEMFSKMHGHYHFWGITDSYEVSHHIQSYFMVFSKEVIHSRVFEQIWENYKVYKNKRNIILQYEIGISRKLLKEGFSMGAYCPFVSLQSTMVCNATHYHWDELIEKFNCPILKIELLRDNPQNLDIANWKSILDKTTYDVSQITNHLSRIKN